MGSSFVRTTLAALALLAAATGASAQEAADTAARRPRIHLLPSLGTMEGEVVGYEPGGGTGVAFLQESRVFGLAAEARSPIRGVDLRAGVAYSAPRMRAGREDGSVPAPITRASITTVTVDAVVRGPRLLDLQPYFLVGAGMRHYNFDHTGYEWGEEAAIVDDQLTPVLRFGAGIAWDVGRYDLYLETSRQHSRLRNGPNLEAQPQEENSVTLGLRIPIH
jgi:hypothetical protein